MAGDESLWRVRDVRAAGATGWSQRAKDVRAPLRGVRVGTGADLDDPCLRAKAAALVLPGGGALAGWAAGALHGIPAGWLDGRDAALRPLPVPVAVPMARRARSRAGLVVRAAHLGAGDVVCVDGACLTSRVRTAFDLVRWAPDLVTSIVLGDACLRFGLATSRQLLDYACTRSGWAGVQRVRGAAPLLDGRAESPPESRLRHLWNTTGLGRPRPQARVHDATGWFIARVDLLDEATGVVGEYQGRWHREGSRPWQDTSRGRALAAVGLEVVEFWSPDLHEPAAVPELLAAAYRSASRRVAGERTYLVER